MSTARIYINPAHVRSVKLAGDVCRIDPVRYAFNDNEGPQSYTHAESPAHYAACIGVHKYFEKQRTAGYISFPNEL
jgi:hypothetical protein